MENTLNESIKKDLSEPENEKQIETEDVDETPLCD